MKKEVKEEIIDEVTVKEESMYKKVNHKSNKNIKRNKYMFSFSEKSVGDFVKVDQVFKADWSYIFYILHELYEDIADLSMYMSWIFFQLYRR